MAKVLEGSAIPPQMAKLDYLKQLIDFPEDHAHLQFTNIVQANFTPSEARRGEFVLTSAKGATLRLACDEEETAMLERALSLLLQPNDGKSHDAMAAQPSSDESMALQKDHVLPAYDDTRVKRLAKASLLLAYGLFGLVVLMVVLSVFFLPMLLVAVQSALLAFCFLVGHALLNMLVVSKQESRIRTEQALIQTALLREWVEQSKN